MFRKGQKPTLIFKEKTSYLQKSWKKSVTKEKSIVLLQLRLFRPLKCGSIIYAVSLDDVYYGFWLDIKTSIFAKDAGNIYKSKMTKNAFSRHLQNIFEWRRRNVSMIFYFYFTETCMSNLLKSGNVIPEKYVPALLWMQNIGRKCKI